MARVPKPCCHESRSVTELDGKVDHDRGSQAHESCETALPMIQMQAVSSLAQQQVYCEHHTPLRGGASPRVNESSLASERISAPNSVTWAASSPAAATAKFQAYPNARMGTLRPGSQPSPPKGPAKEKWNSDVRCSWSPTSPPRGGGGALIPRRLTATPEARTKNVAVMTFPAIDAGELIKKVEALELELDVHAGNERQLLTVNEQLRKRLEVCLRELHDAAMMNVQLDNLGDEMEKILQLLRHLSGRNAALEKEKAEVQAKLEREAALNRFQAQKMLMERQVEDHDVDLCDAQCQTICTCEQVDTRKRRRERKRWLKEEETATTNQLRSRSLSYTD